MIINFIRHGKTEGNLKKQYIGITNESLCSKGIEEIKNNSYPSADLVISSPLKRCIETAKLIYPNQNIKIYDDLRECDFGDFEGKNYDELKNNKEYQKWIDSGGKIAFPNGESGLEFKTRCINAFDNIIKDIKDYENVSFIVHGGTIMSILEKYGVPKKNFYDYQVSNGKGFTCIFSQNKEMQLYIK